MPVEAKRTEGGRETGCLTTPSTVLRAAATPTPASEAPRRDESMRTLRAVRDRVPNRVAHTGCDTDPRSGRTATQRPIEEAPHR